MKKQTEGEFQYRFGRMVKGINPLLLKDDQISDSQNMQPGFFGWKQRAGMSELTTSAIATSLRFKSMLHFRDLKNVTDDIVAHVYDSVNGERIMSQGTLPTSTHLGNTWSAKYTLTASCNNTQFATVAGALIAANNKEFLVWRGDQHLPSGVWKWLDTVDAYEDYWDELTDNNSSTYMTLSSMTAGDFVYITAPQPMDKVIVDMGDVNSTAAWMLFEYFNSVWTILKPASWWSTTEYLDEDCDGTLVAMGWDDDDNNGTTTAPSSFLNRVCIKLDSGAAGAGNFAKISKDVGTLGATCVVSVLANCDNIGLLANVDVFQITVDNGDVLCKVRIGTDGISTYDGASWNEIGDISVTEDEWNVWTLAIDSTTPASATVTVYRNGTQVGVATDCSDTGGTVADGDIILTSLGENTANQITYVRQITVGDTLDTTGDAFVDGTSLSSATLGQDGNITWTAPGDEVKTLTNGTPGYAVRFAPNLTIDSSVTMLDLDVHTPFNTVRAQWSGKVAIPAGAYVYDGTDYTDYTYFVGNTVTSQYMDLAGVTTTDKVYVGFPFRVNRLTFHPVQTAKNTNAVTISTVKYMAVGGSFTSVGTFTDTTEAGSKTLAQKGDISWQDPGRYVEKMTKLSSDTVPYYWYEIVFSGALADPTQVYYITGVPIDDDPELCYGCFGWKRRAWQIAPLNKENTVRYSAENMIDVWGGPDSGYIQFGERPLLCAAPFYNETVLWADTEMWMLQGNSPSNFGKLRLSANIGCAAPHSVISIESGVQVGESMKNVLVWFFYDGIWMFDGVRIMKISSPDVDSFFDSSHADYINPAKLNETQGVYDHETQCGMWSVYSGSTATSPTKVLVIHFPSMWYGIYDYTSGAASSAEAYIGPMCRVYNNKWYTVAGGFATGKAYLLNSGTTDVNSSGTAVAVDAYIITRDMFTSYSDGMMQRLLSIWMESQSAGGLIEIDEYPDGSDTPQTISKHNMRWLGKLFGMFQKTLKIWPGQISTKFRIRNRSKNAKMNLLGFSTTVDRGRSDE